MNTNVVIIDDVRSDVAILEIALASEPEFSVAYTPWTDPDEIERILESIKREQSSVILLDVFFDGQEKGDKIYRLLKEANNNAQVIVLSVREDFETQKKYINLGAYDYVIKDSSPGVIRNVIAGIKLAGDKGVQYLAEFEAIDQLYNNEPEHALSQFEALFKRGFNNLNCSKQYTARLKAYLGRSFDRTEFPIATLFEMMLANCQRIEAADPSDFENLMDMAALYLHRGEEGKAVQVFRKLLFGSEASSSVTNKLFSWMENVYYSQTLALADVAWLRTKLIDQKNQDEQRILITALRDYKQNLWTDALLGWFEVLDDMWNQGDKEQTAKLVVWLLSEYGAKDILEAINKTDKKFRERIIQLCNRVSLNMSALSITGRLSLFELVLDHKNLLQLTEAENQTYYDLLEELLLEALDSEASSLGETRKIYELMGRLRLTSTGRILGFLNEIKSAQPLDWYKRFKSFVDYLSSTGDVDGLQKLIDENRKHLFKTTTPDSLMEIGKILDQASPSPTSLDFYREAASKQTRLAESSQSMDELDAAHRTVLMLKDRGYSDWKGLERDLTRIRMRLQKSLKALDGKKIAVFGGHPDRKNDLPVILENEFGGKYSWYDATDEKDAHKLANALQHGSFDTVIFISGYASHSASGIVTSKISVINGYAGGGEAIRLITIPKDQKGAPAVANAVKERLGIDETPSNQKY